MKHLSFGWVILAALILWGAIVVGVITAANAQPPEGLKLDPQIADWFRTLRNPVTGAFCCDEADGTILKESEWRAAGNDYEVRLDAHWEDVPSEAVLNNISNPTGNAVVFKYGDKDSLLRPTVRELSDAGLSLDPRTGSRDVAAPWTRNERS